MHLGHFFQLRIEIYSSLLASVRVIVPPNVIRFIIPINQTSLQFPESQSPLFANNSWRVQSTSNGTNRFRHCPSLAVENVYR